MILAPYETDSPPSISARMGGRPLNHSISVLYPLPKPARLSSGSTSPMETLDRFV
jgi:hypothetical protein